MKKISLELIRPVTVKSVTVFAFPPAAVSAALKPPAVGTFTVIETCAEAIIVNSAMHKVSKNFFIVSV